MPKIGEILIARGHLTQEGLEEALDWQVLYGGKLGTNLLELKLIEEEQLAHALGKQMGAEVAWGDIQVDPSLIGVIPKHVADRSEIIPWKVDKRRLKILCTEIKVGELDKLSYKIDRTCVPVVAPEFRIFQLLRAHYQAIRQMRALDFGVVPDEGREERRRMKQKVKGNVVEEAPELIDEDAFNDIYAQVVQGRSSAPPQQAALPPQAWSRGHPASPGHPRDPQPLPAPSWNRPPAPPAGPPVMTPVATPEPEQVRSRTARRIPTIPPPALEEQVELLPDDAILEPLPSDAIMSDAAADVQAALEADLPLKPVTWDEPPPAKPPADESPLEFKEALKALEGVTDRNSIAHIVLRASRSKAARALLLQVQGGVAIGWDGLGEGLENGAARQVAMPLGAESAFSLVVKTRSHYMGPLQKTPLNIRFLATLGKKVPLSSLIFPILHRGRVSHMLYLDNGHKQQAPTDVGEMLILSQRISQTVEALVERKRKAARG
jgi:hypothetical protein